VDVSIDDFVILKKLGSGAYSSVYHVRRKDTSKEYALKKVSLKSLSEKERRNAINEVRILASIRSKYITRYKQVFIDRKYTALCIVMEYADSGDLYQQILERQKNKEFFAEEDVWRVLIHTIRGLQSLHALNVMHRDIKSANIFLNKNRSVKLGDMNVSKLADKNGLNYTQTGTPYYASPEVWKDEPYGFKSDIWSLGCVIYEMICLEPPFKAEDMQGLYRRVLKGKYKAIPLTYSTDLIAIVRNMLMLKPDDRYSCDHITELPAFKTREALWCPYKRSK
jgi:NIMA (never in mitosis gene a)-related kinase 1/4/5